ncbi:MAG: class I tRNA ligase family protein [Candidatus Paceibacterota bacterium]
MRKETFNHKEIEKAAQAKWAELDLYRTDLTDTTKDPYYLMFEFPFPSGDLHIGHWYAFALTDIYARYLRAMGKNVLFPMGFDAFGLPAENAAMKRGLDTRTWTYESMERMRTQVRTMGTSVDWSKEVVTSDPEYYHWTQWLFTKLFEQGLAYRGSAVVNWDPVDNTVLANEQVLSDGTAERSGAVVEKRRLEQWFLGITKYAERLLTDIDPLPWKEDIKDAQRAWIGKSDGATLSFVITFKNDPTLNDWRDDKGNPASLAVFTTRPDTLFGATYVVLAPEHPWVTRALEDHADVLSNAVEVKKYVEKTKRKSERERMENKEKSGVKLEGITAINPATHEEIPVYVADYVIGSYGTGAVMAVPAHDERDFEFAQLFNLPVTQVVAHPFKQTTEPGVYREGEPTLVKDGIITIIKHWKEDKYMGLAWKKVAWGTFLTGGVDEGMTPEETVIKEIREETGYLHAKIVKKLMVVDGLFYHVPKEKNQHVHGHVFYVELVDDTKETVDAEEDEKHEIKWLTLDEMEKFITPDTHKHALEVFKNGYAPYTGDGSLIDSGEFTGRDNEEAKWDIVSMASGERTTNYRLRDWLVSRQRYWGCPIPIVYDPEGKPHAVPAEHLPWLLPTDVTSTTKGPNGKAPLAASKELADRVVTIFGEGWTPEYDTLDVFVDSSWYYLRYLSPQNNQAFSDQALMKKWMPVDRYSGGSEHTTVHLLYARFFYKALYDLGLVPTVEPFNERFNRGLILGTDGQKMSKRWGNVLNPDEFVEKYGADAVRMYLAFIGPYNEAGSYPWKHEGIESMRRFLDRIYALRTKVQEGIESTIPAQKSLARASQKVASDLTRFKTNTAVSALMVLMNALEDEEQISSKDFVSFLEVLAPLAPHLAEALYEEVSKSESAQSVHSLSWPEFDQSLLEDDTVVIGVQVAGKTRGEVSISPTATEEKAVAAALQDPKVLQSLPGGAPTRVIYVPGRILNLIP